MVENIIFHGNFGYSFEYQKPVNEIIAEKLPLSIGLTLGALIISWALAIPIGIYSAIYQYSKFDYFFTFIGFLGLATPPFLMALIFAWLPKNTERDPRSTCLLYTSEAADDS